LTNSISVTNPQSRSVKRIAPVKTMGHGEHRVPPKERDDVGNRRNLADRDVDYQEAQRVAGRRSALCSLSHAVAAVSRVLS
jgi:hypothetical protein